MKIISRDSISLYLIFIIFSIIIFIGNSLFNQWRADKIVLHFANFLFLLMSLTVFYMQKKALVNSNPNVFIRSIMAGMLIKMAVIMLALILYWQISGNSFNKTTVVIAVALYLVYFITGVYCTMQLNKSKNA